MAEFKVGDKVVVITEYGVARIGDKAKVVVCDGGVLGLDIKGCKLGHDLDNRLVGGLSGWWTPSQCVKKLSEFKGNV